MFDERDRQIVEELRRDGRAKLVDIAERTGIPVSTVHERVAKLLDGRVRMVSIPNYRFLNVPLVCWAVIRTDDRDPVRESLLDDAFVNTLLETNNGAAFVCECVFPGFAQQYAFQEMIEEHGRVSFYPLIEEIGRETATVRR